MKNILRKILITPVLFLIVGCGQIGAISDNTNSNDDSYISFQEYVEIVNSATDSDKNVFMFASSSCPHCQAIKPLLKKYIRENEDEDLHIYELSVDSKAKNGKRVFKDKTMGYLSGNADDDCIKRLDNRISQYVKSNEDNYYIYDELIPLYDSIYSYVATPLMLFYKGNIEVRIVNSVSSFLETNKNNEYTYESFVNYMTYPANDNNWDKEFDLTHYSA